MSELRSFSDYMDDVVENVDGLGPKTAKNIRREMTLPEFEMACSGAYRHGNLWGLEKADGVGPELAEKIGEYVCKNKK